MSARGQEYVDERRGSHRDSHQDRHRDRDRDRHGDSGRKSDRASRNSSGSDRRRDDGQRNSRKRARSDSGRTHRTHGRSHVDSSSDSSPSSRSSDDADLSSSSSSRSRSRSVSPSDRHSRHHRRARKRSAHRTDTDRERHRERRGDGRAATRRPPASDGAASVSAPPAGAVIQSAAALAGYTDADNPFNDQQITKPFTWHKKNQQQQHSKVKHEQTSSTSAEALQARQLALVAEVEEVKQRRLAREEERRAMDAMKEQMERERAAEQVLGWEEKEEEFHRQQARQRTKIRVQERRERAVDLLMKNVAFEQWLAEDEEEERIRRQRERMVAGAASASSNSSHSPAAAHSSSVGTRSSLLREAQLTNPVSLLSALPLHDLLELRGELGHLLELKEHGDYWGAIAVLCDDEIERCKGERREGNAGVAADVLRGIAAMLANKSASELRVIGEQVHSGLEEGVDVPYWRAVGQQLAVQQAKAALRDAHSDMIRRRLELLNEERRRRDAQQAGTQQQQQHGQLSDDKAVGGGEGERSGEGEGRDGMLASDRGSASTSSSPPMLLVDTHRAAQSVDASVLTDDSNADHHLSPRLFSVDEQLDVPVIDAADDQRVIAQQRAAVLATYQPHITMAQLHTTDTTAAAASRSADSAGGSSEYTIANEISVPSAAPSTTSSSLSSSSSLPWSSKWRPRKPRYFNRVKTGFDWNKYNQVHYDKDNPPPKLVQGYKFNIFYPDLIDPTRTPTYRLQPLHEGDEQGAYCILRFEAGPPYEDVAFKIVRKVWEFGPRRGFRCSFDKGVLQLHFNFKRYFYRR